MPEPQDLQRRRLPLSDNPTGRGLLLAALVLLAVGVVMVPSALATVTLASPAPWLARASVRHVIFAVLAGAMLLVAWRVDYCLLSRGGRLPIAATAALAVALACGVLVLVPGVGREVGGYRRWIRVGPIGFQPSELIKLTLVVFLAAWLGRDDVDAKSFARGFLPAAGITGVCAMIVVTQDFGTAVVIAAVAGVTMLLAGVRLRYLLGLCCLGATALAGMLASSPRRWLRVKAMLDPFSTENPSSYQLRQSLTAITTGGVTGKGLGLGMMKRGFLPEDSTDFLFAILCEEWGLIGAAALVMVLLAYLVLSRRAASEAGEKFGRVLAASLGFLIVLQAAMHIAVNVGFLPPTGISMPLVSAGGTSLILAAAATALIVSVSSRGCGPGAAITQNRSDPLIR